MIKRLAKLPYWEIIAIGLSSTIVVMIGILGAFTWAETTWPQAQQAAYMGYLILNSAAAWILVGITVEACGLRRRNKVITKAVATIIDLMMNPKDEISRG